MVSRSTNDRKSKGAGGNGKYQASPTGRPALTIQGPRLPYVPEVKEKFNIDEEAWRALVEAIFPDAQSPGSIILVLAYCKSRNLDVFKRNVHIVPIWDPCRRDYVDTIWPGIGELRTTAFRTRQYAGRDQTRYGEDITYTWRAGRYKLTLTFPAWAQVTVYRMIDGQRVAFDGPPVYWLETFAADREGLPNRMWQKRPHGQIDKCAEAAALRAAFPEELGDIPCADEGPMLVQHGGEPFETDRAGEVGTALGLAGCKERMRQAVASAPAETAGPQTPSQSSQPPAEIAVPPCRAGPDLIRRGTGATGRTAAHPGQHGAGEGGGGDAGPTELTRPVAVRELAHLQYPGVAG